MPTKSVRYMSKREFAVVTMVVTAMLLSFGWMGAKYIGIEDGRAMPAPVRLIPATEFAKVPFAGTIGEEVDAPKWSEVLLFVDYAAVLADRRPDSAETVTAKSLRPGV